MGRAMDESGKRYGRLFVIGLAKERLYGTRRSFLCRCDCGKTVLIPGNVLREGRQISCGCFRDEKSRTHGCSGPTGKRSGAYSSWAGVIQRCTNPRAVAYQQYGARGITVCERWRVFENFLADMGERPPGMSIDRWPDQNGNYEPGNCRWATQTQQVRNSSTVKLNEETVEAIRRDIEAGARNCELAPKYGIHNSAISRIRHGLVWR